MNEDARSALEETLAHCLESWEQGKLDDLAPAVIIDEYLEEREIWKLESDETLGPLWRFLQSFCDAAQHRMPNVSSSCSVSQGAQVLEEINDFIAGRTSQLKAATVEVIRSST